MSCYMSIITLRSDDDDDGDDDLMIMITAIHQTSDSGDSSSDIFNAAYSSLRNHSATFD